jgi:hypothetical protein
MSGASESSGHNPGQNTGRFNLSALAVRERSVTLFFLIAIILAGVFAFLKLGRAEDPGFTIKVMTVVTAVRRQNIWHIRRRKLAESGPRLGFGFRRRACGVASVDVRWSVA